MKSILKMLFATMMIAGTAAQAEEMDDTSLMLTEGKIEATLENNKEAVLKDIQKMRDKLFVEIEKVGLSTNETGSSNGKLTALGQYDFMLETQMQQAKRAKSSSIQKLERIREVSNVLLNEAMNLANKAE
jgi:hypothetical protein